MSMGKKRVPPFVAHQALEGACPAEAGSTNGDTLSDARTLQIRASFHILIRSDRLRNELRRAHEFSPEPFVDVAPALARCLV